MARSTSGPAVVRLEELEADTHLHIHKENNLLFSGVLALEAERSG